MAYNPIRNSGRPLVRYARTLQNGRLLTPEQAIVQAAADRGLESMLIKSLPEESDERLASLVQRTYAAQNCLELREKPTRWRLAEEFFKQVLPRTAAASVIPIAVVLLTNRINPAYFGDIYDNLTFLPYFLAAGADHGTTIRATKTADGLELNPFFQKLGYSRRTQIAGWLLTVGGAVVLPSAALLAIAALRGWVAYHNYQIPQQVITHTARRLAKERCQPLATLKDKTDLQASPGPAV